MSREGLTLQEALAALSYLEEQVEGLRRALLDLEQRRANLAMLEEALRTLENGAEDALVFLDRNGAALVRASVKKPERVIVHAGLDVYVEVSYEKALGLVRDSSERLAKIRSELAQRLEVSLQQYTALREAVERALAAAQPQRAQ